MCKIQTIAFFIVNRVKHYQHPQAVDKNNVFPSPFYLNNLTAN